MTPKSDYIDIAAKLEAISKELITNSKEQAITNTELQNVIKMFHDHLADDKRTVEKVDGLLTREARLDSRIIGLSACCTAIGYIVGKLPIHW